jgi:tRNA(Ile)-lysidine synthase
MLAQFIEYSEKNGLFHASDKILVAVSGGVDSMVLLHLIHQTGISFSVAHCNFHLRDEESDGDEKFVRHYAEKNKFQLFTEHFNTREYARLNGISIEMAARKLRYEYFKNLSVNQKFNAVATAHHQDDLIETFFINLIRKTGIRGLTGIKNKSGNIIRPLLFTDRNRIYAYAVKNNIPFREDSTNTQTDYIRNYIRHKIIPEFVQINPAFLKNTLASINNLKNVEEVFQHSIQAEKKRVVQTEGAHPVLSVKNLLAYPFPRILLYEILIDYNFNPAVIDEVFEGICEESGKQYFSPTHRAVKDRDEIIITENKEKDPSVFYMEEGDLELFTPLHISINTYDAKNFAISHNPLEACLDYEKLDFPLCIRKWKIGEYFKPLGMSGFKKISDFFIDEKLSIPEKENTWILYSGNKVVWIIGQRIDDRFKITPYTKTVYHLKIKQKK